MAGIQKGRGCSPSQATPNSRSWLPQRGQASQGGHPRDGWGHDTLRCHDCEKPLFCPEPGFATITFTSMFLACLGTFRDPCGFGICSRETPLIAGETCPWCSEGEMFEFRWGTTQSTPCRGGGLVLGQGGVEARHVGAGTARIEAQGG